MKDSQESFPGSFRVYPWDPTNSPGSLESVVWVVLVRGWTSRVDRRPQSRGEGQVEVTTQGENGRTGPGTRWKGSEEGFGRGRKGLLGK